MNDQVSERQEAAIRRRQTVRIGSIAVIVSVLAAIVLDNRDSVRLGFVVGEREAPLIVALVVAFVLGVLAGLLARRERRE